MHVELIYNVVLVPAVQLSDSVIHIYICVCVYIYVLFYILFIMAYHSILNIVPCAIQEDFVVYPF